MFGLQAFQKVRNLLPYMKKLPSKRVVKLDGLAADPLRFSLSYNTSTHHGLPPGVAAPELAAFEVKGIEGVIKRYNVSGQVCVHARSTQEWRGLMRHAHAVCGGAGAQRSVLCTTITTTTTTITHAALGSSMTQASPLPCSCCPARLMACRCRSPPLPAGPSPQTALRFEADYGGLLRLDSVEAVVEYEVMEEKIVVEEEPPAAPGAGVCAGRLVTTTPQRGGGGAHALPPNACAHAPMSCACVRAPSADAAARPCQRS